MTPPTLSSSSIGSLSDRAVLAEVAHAVSSERRATAHLLSLLMELDTRRLFLGEGFSSLFTYCTQALHLSEHAAYNRIEAARAARRFPVILELIREGAVTLTAVRLLAPHLTLDNHREVLAAARHKSKRDVEHLVARLHPQPDVPPVVRRLPASTPALTMPASAMTTSVQPDVTETTASPSPRIAPPSPTPRAEVMPIAPERYKIQFTASRETYEKLRRAQALLRHTFPDGDPALIVDRALTLLVSELERKKNGAADCARPVRPAIQGSRHIPAHVKRAVWQRDAGQCAFVGEMGRCSETSFLEYHHVVPFAAGGETSAGNISLRCHAHNNHEARQYFGVAGLEFDSEEANG